VKDTHVLVICVRETHACVSHKCVCASLPGLLLLLWSAHVLVICVRETHAAAMVRSHQFVCLCVRVRVCVCLCLCLQPSVGVCVCVGGWGSIEQVPRALCTSAQQEEGRAGFNVLGFRF